MSITIDLPFEIFDVWKLYDIKHVIGFKNSAFLRNFTSDRDEKYESTTANRFSNGCYKEVFRDKKEVGKKVSGLSYFLF
jgi:hypothetical protein